MPPEKKHSVEIGFYSVNVNIAKFILDGDRKIYAGVPQKKWNL